MAENSYKLIHPEHQFVFAFEKHGVFTISGKELLNALINHECNKKRQKEWEEEMKDASRLFFPIQQEPKGDLN